MWGLKREDNYCPEWRISSVKFDLLCETLLCDNKRRNCRNCCEAPVSVTREPRRWRLVANRLIQKRDLNKWNFQTVLGSLCKRFLFKNTGGLSSEDQGLNNRVITLVLFHVASLDHYETHLYFGSFSRCIVLQFGWRHSGSYPMLKLTENDATIFFTVRNEGYWEERKNAYILWHQRRFSRSRAYRKFP